MMWTMPKGFVPIWKHNGFPCKYGEMKYLPLIILMLSRSIQGV